MTDNQQDIERHGREDELQGKGNQVAGWFQKTLGRLTGNRKDQVKGSVREFGGKVQAKGGQIEQRIEQKLAEQDRQAQAEAQREQTLESN